MKEAMGSKIDLAPKKGALSGTFELPLSKSMVNRALLLAALFPEDYLERDEQFQRQPIFTASTGWLFG